MSEEPRASTTASRSGPPAPRGGSPCARTARSSASSLSSLRRGPNGGERFQSDRSVCCTVAGRLPAVNRAGGPHDDVPLPIRAHPGPGRGRRRRVVDRAPAAPEPDRIGVRLRRRARRRDHARRRGLRLGRLLARARGRSRRAGRTPADVTGIALTHNHPDHVGLADRIRAATAPGSPFILSMRCRRSSAGSARSSSRSRPS